MTPRRLPRRARVVAAGLLLLALAGCFRSVEGVPTAARSQDEVPSDVDQLEPLIVASVPSGLPRLPDQRLHPPAGPKTVEDVAAYSADPARERRVLEGYGYRFGWERFWGHDGGPLTSVFVDQFDSRHGASAYAADLAANDAARYGGMLREEPPRLPGGCRLLTVREPRSSDDLTGPTVFAWCAQGVFSVGVTAVAESVEAAADEVHAVVAEQLGLLPPG